MFAVPWEVFTSLRCLCVQWDHEERCLSVCPGIPKQRQTVPPEGHNPVHSKLLLEQQFQHKQFVFFAVFVSRMIEESGKRRRTMAEKRQLFMEMSE